MSDIQRWWPDIEGKGVLRPVMRPIPDDFHPDDEYVTYADHVAALAQAEQRAANAGVSLGYERVYEQGQRDAERKCEECATENKRDALAAAVHRVEALPVGGPEGELEWPEEILPGATVVKAAAIAAIKGDNA